MSPPPHPRKTQVTGPPPDSPPSSVFDPAKLVVRRLAKGLTLAALGAELNVSAAAVSKWERGRSRPEINKVPRLAEVLGCEIAELFSHRPAA